MSKPLKQEVRTQMKVKALYHRMRDVFDRRTDDELFNVPCDMYCDHIEYETYSEFVDTAAEWKARFAEAKVCIWLLKQRRREDLLQELRDRLPRAAEVSGLYDD
jgi:hypothetical protein